MTQPVTTTDMEELLEEEVPCRKCDKAAVLMSRCHGHGTSFRCVACYQKWLINVLDIISRFGLVRCPYCKAEFGNVDEFSQWRPF